MGKAGPRSAAGCSHATALGASAALVAPERVPRRPSPVAPVQVCHLGEGEASRQWLQQAQNSTAALCLAHIRAVASLTRARHPATTPLVWDDMLRDLPEDQLSGQPARVRGEASWCRGRGQSCC